MTIYIDGNHLSLKEVEQVARFNEPVALDPEAESRIQDAHRRLNEIVATDRAVYGINTGFGIFADRRIPRKDSATLSRNLIISHAVGTGEPFPREVVRAAMLIRANTLAKGYSGVRLEIVETLLEMLNRGVTPLVPSQGSLGSSGDLLPLSSMALVFTTDEKDEEKMSGWAEFAGEVMSGKKAMELARLPRIRLGPKEGLALNNGATFSAAVAALAVCDAEKLLHLSHAALAMSLEALLGCRSAFDPRIHQVRGHPGQVRVAKEVLNLIRGSSLIDLAGRVQDAYSLRCAPQVVGAAWDTLEFVREIISREINAATDNPLLFEDGDVLSGGNFHGEPIGMAMDYLAIAMSEVAAISERRIFRLTDGKLNGGLPPMLVDSVEAAGLNSGLMMPQYTAASLVLENQTLSTPDSVHSLPTSGEQEDHNANSMTAARHARKVLENTAHVLAIECYTAARALDLRLRQYPQAQMGVGTKHFYDLIRAEVPYQPGDAWWGPEIEQVKRILMEYPIGDVIFSG
ncbi:histidine ammonia-lyase [Anaerolinea thermophila]|uniref:Histidine ammonia-lyase n=1 Tax=Anaerolinea thermophila (strain DSM 14523 / JCM 11388 / NBRC 100420 / UNI-1) TaxID=926569 RepID=E8N613_ANATU|nr:histidine ammonia-lyase [Anaerolinea thermophila]BAJ63877.1 histidine ammonia-lyase [Anaerolinea thermophila UNI-1]